MSTFVIVHGGWHTGAHFEATANVMRNAGHTVYLPTVRGNADTDSRDTGLGEAIASVVAYIETNDISDFVLAGHSYGGMVITGVADRLPDRIRRLVYWNAFVPHDGEALNDLVPRHYVELFDDLIEPDGGVMLPFPVWRDAFINDATLELARSSYASLNPHPIRTFREPIRLRRTPAAFPMAKSYLNCTEDSALPQSLGWHPRLSERLGLFRLVQTPGSHELCFTAPARLGRKLIEAGRD